MQELTPPQRPVPDAYQSLMSQVPLHSGPIMPRVVVLGMGGGALFLISEVPMHSSLRIYRRSCLPPGLWPVFAVPADPPPPL